MNFFSNFYINLADFLLDFILNGFGSGPAYTVTFLFFTIAICAGLIYACCETPWGHISIVIIFDLLGVFWSICLLCSTKTPITNAQFYAVRIFTFILLTFTFTLHIIPWIYKEESLEVDYYLIANFLFSNTTIKGGVDSVCTTTLGIVGIGTLLLVLFTKNIVLLTISIIILVIYILMLTLSIICLVRRIKD